MRHLQPLAFVTLAVCLLSVGAVQAAPAPWLDMAREMAADGETIRTGTSGGGGWYIVAISEVVSADNSSEAESLQRARLVGKRLISGFVAGEKVSASEESTITESTVGDTTESHESFRQRISVNVDTVLRGTEVAGTIKTGNGHTFLVIVASTEAADASAALAAKMAELGPDTVSARGFAPISEGGIPTAQKAALASAKSSAVEMVLGSSVASTEVALNLNAGAKVFSNASGFIESFRITEEGNQDGVWMVTIVAKVARDRLMKDYGTALAQFGNVKFHVEKTGRDDLDAMLEEKFTEWKCPLTSDRRAADYLVRARWEFADETHPMDGRDGTRLTLTIRMLDAATGKEYFAVNNDPRKAASFIGDRRRRIRNAANLAMKEIHERIHERLDAMIGTMAASGRDIRMVFDNYSEAYAEALETIRTTVDAIPGCNNAIIKISAATRIAEISLRCQTDMNTFRQLMEKSLKTALPSASMRPDTVSCDANTWNLSW
ncbi:MAG: hypothetical protein ACI4QT_01955 [Kiritimatiellia bacterium]